MTVQVLPGTFAIRPLWICRTYPSRKGRLRAVDDGKIVAHEAGGFEAKFDQGDLFGWILGFLPKLFTKRHPWQVAPDSATPIANQLRLGLLADWGTGLYGAPVAAATMAADPRGFDLLMHLGDVYYSGTAKEIREQFLPYWPRNARMAHLALNSNHEMYSGGHGYFGVTLPTFANWSTHFRQTSSFFALQNDYYTLVGLDTGYDDHDLGQGQAAWLRQVVDAAGDRKVILFSHHQPYSLYESQGPKIVRKMARLLESQRIYAWYWGHEHRLVVYDTHAEWNLRGRCLGHGGMPYLRDSFDGAEPDRTALYREEGRRKKGIDTPDALVLDGPNPYVQGHERKHGPNGYVVLELNGPDLIESFHLPDGSVILQQALS